MTKEEIEKKIALAKQLIELNEKTGNAKPEIMAMLHDEVAYYEEELAKLGGEDDQ